jgi:uncharacterized protein (DUF2164 family)
MLLQLEPREKDILIEKIIRFFAVERDEEIGYIAAEIVLDFFIEEVGKGIYNKGVNDAQAFITGKIGDIMYDVDELKF